MFFANAANFPWGSHALWFLHQMQRWGYVGTNVDRKAATTIFRPDLFAEAARALGLSVPASRCKNEGSYATAWQLPAKPAPIPMGPDLFMDGARFVVAGSEKD